MSEKLAQWIRNSRKVVLLTGAGMSTESGIPDFRSSSGWWKQINPHDVATIEALENNYSLFHQFYSYRLTALASCEPHIGHQILAKWESKNIIDFVATQNVDGLHQKAGSQNVSELHGSIQAIRCHQCGTEATKDEFLEEKACTACGGRLRPSVVLFGEMLPENSWKRALTTMEQADLVIVIGTSLQVYPVNQLPYITKGRTVIINNEKTQSDANFDLCIHGSAKEILVQTNNLLEQGGLS
ncbi:NAD-dependent protein deacylase [Bacillus alkalicellulosilyticus]|uniref:NAD-dependent protein deacylase n=1 Tax=Alkalihalobacterium alkalicellulosilyticum TaxID=1912214 RepID=UPI000997D5CB|nr:NAD-dependent protein deacylase [Bacillus alkalicellulosilyticus]